MGKKIVVSFPGARGCEIPLLYFGAKHFEDMGYEKRFVSYPANREITLENLLNNALEILRGIDWKEYADVVFIAKSIGTVVCCKAKEMLGIPAKLVLYTPLEQTLAYIRKDNDVILVAMGDEDPYPWGVAEAEAGSRKPALTGTFSDKADVQEAVAEDASGNLSESRIQGEGASPQSAMIGDGAAGADGV